MLKTTRQELNVEHTPAPKSGCIFCQIVSGQASVHKVWEDAHTLVLMDLFPAHDGHTLIIPKPHWVNIYEAPVDHLERIMRVSKPLAEALNAAFKPDGLSVFQLNGAAAGQTVFHYHMHLIPRMQGMPLHIHGRRKADAATLDGWASRIRDALPSDFIPNA
ncbi:MAG: histidine triad (HIT) family protein [Gammaproteobacteria bacterium]|jgi:histidine triad (HIT) family protein